TAITEGSATITATAGEVFASCIVTVTKTSSSEPKLEFGLTKDEIIGYVTVSFEDKGIRKTAELDDIDSMFKKPLGTIIKATKVPFKKDDTIAAVTLRLLDELDYSVEYEGDENSGFYLETIGNFKINGKTCESFGEFDAGQDSGWMITWNEWFIDQGASEFKVKDDDIVRWQYTCQLGRDIGDDYFEREDSATDTTTKEEEQKPSASITPEASANSKGEASVGIKKDELTSAVKEATKDGTSGEVVIAPEIKGDASKITVEMPKDVVDSVAISGKTDLTVKTDIATVTLPAETLKELPADGKTVSVAVEKVEDKISVEVAVDNKAVDKIGSGVVASIPAKDVSATSVLMIVDAEGNETIVKKSAVADGEITALLEGSCTVVVKDNKKEFTDIEGHWGKAAAEFASSRELFNGVGNGQFGMNTTMNRAMMATVFYNLENGPDHDGEHDFHDVQDHKYYAKPAAWAAEHGVLSGYTDGSFRPDAPITREQLAVMLWNYSGKPSGIKALDHSDAGNISNYAKEAMQWAVENGVMSGRANGQLDPKGAATRAEVAQMFKNYIEKVVL
ncbi:MAG: S-layer homology domain-containing protein, partial [Firmicutes bacterium]|nr:S-layer homology domain-containing protein [Bacillota bacterium]